MAEVRMARPSPQRALSERVHRLTKDWETPRREGRRISPDELIANIAGEVRRRLGVQQATCRVSFPGRALISKEFYHAKSQLHRHRQPQRRLLEHLGAARWLDRPNALPRHFATRKKAEQLLGLGNLFRLGEVGEAHDGQWLPKLLVKSVVDQVRGRAANVDARIQKHPLRRFCDAFGRDWGEPGHERKFMRAFVTWCGRRGSRGRRNCCVRG